MGKQLDRDKVLGYLRAGYKGAMRMNRQKLADLIDSGAFDFDQGAVQFKCDTCTDARDCDQSAASLEICTEQLPIKERDLTLDQRITNEEQHNIQIYRALEDRIAKLEDIAVTVPPPQEAISPQRKQFKCIQCLTWFSQDDVATHKCQ
jgi:hypothetical protein